MKNIIFFLVLTFIVNTPKAHALFGHVAQERQRRIKTERKLEKQQAISVQEQRVTTRWQIASLALGSSGVVALSVGTVIGSKTRRDHEAAVR